MVVYNHPSALSVWDPAFSAVLSDFRPWKDGEDLIPHRRWQEDGAADSPGVLTDLHGSSPPVLEDPSLMLEEFAPPERDVASSRGVLILRNRCIFPSKSLAQQIRGQ